MTLRDRPLLYVFLEAHALDDQRRFLESVAGLPVIETDTDPGHRHGVLKYEAGRVIISLNLAPPARFPAGSSDGLVIGFAGGDRLHTDAHGHHYLLGEAPPAVAEFRLRVTTGLAASVDFYRDVLGLELLTRTAASAAFATGTVPLVLEEAARAADGRALRYDTYLLVFHTADIERHRAALAARGLTFTGRGVGSKEIGWTIRFADPSGHRFCLYQPSDAALGWSSGGVVRRILAGRS